MYAASDGGGGGKNRAFKWARVRWRDMRTKKSDENKGQWLSRHHLLSACVFNCEVTVITKKRAFAIIHPRKPTTISRTKFQSPGKEEFVMTLFGTFCAGLQLFLFISGDSPPPIRGVVERREGEGESK